MCFFGGRVEIAFQMRKALNEPTKWSIDLNKVKNVLILHDACLSSPIDRISFFNKNDLIFNIEWFSRQLHIVDTLEN